MILWNCDFGTGFIIRDLFRKLHLQILQKEETGEVEQHSRIGGYERVPSLLEQGPTERP